MIKIKFGLLVLLLLGFSGAVHADTKEPSYCGPRSDRPIDSATTLSGEALMSSSDDGMLIVAMDIAGKGEATHVFRIALQDESKALPAFSVNSEALVSLTVLERRGGFYQELEVVFPQHPEFDITFFVDASDCSPLATDSLSIVAADALAISVLPEGVGMHEAIRDASSHPVLTVEPSGETLSAPLLCMSGGPGASACSIDFGGVGPVTIGSCSASCVPPRYACCGLGFGAYCSCIYPDPSNGSPICPGGGGLPPVIPGPGDDEDDEDPPGEDESQGVVDPDG